jgi:ATP adenylyltransferase
VKRLWAPWRMAYVGGSVPSPGCLFCNVLAGNDDRKHLILLRSTGAFLILNAYPYTPGHLMAVLDRHVGSVVEATGEELSRMMQLVGLATTALTDEYRADGFNIGMNQGKVAGAGIENHLHIHVVPRWQGDSNFMPVLGEVRVLPEALDTTWERLRSRLGG